jgi:hypothetical protein
VNDPRYYLGRKKGEVKVYMFNSNASEVIYKEVTLFFQIVLVILTALNVQGATGICVNAKKDIIMSQDNASNVQVRK